MLIGLIYIDFFAVDESGFQRHWQPTVNDVWQQSN